MPKTLVERIHEKQLFFTYTLQFSHPKLSPWCGNEEGNPAYFLSSFHKVYLPVQMQLLICGDFCCSLPHHFIYSSPPPGIRLLLQPSKVLLEIPVYSYK